MRQQLGSHLSLLVRRGVITFWSDRVIRPGDEIDKAISANLETADVILLLVSADFLASNYCYDFELCRALELHELGKAQVVPVILRDCDWHHAPFGRLMALPTDGRPVKSWPDRDKAYRIIVDHLRSLIESLPGKGRGAASPIEPEPELAAPITPVLDLAKLLAKTRGPGAGKKAEPANPDKFLPQLAQLIDIADDLERLSADIRHARGGGCINYVFDTNVFQLFFEPQRFARAVSLFHAPVWGSSGDDAGWQQIDAQSALLAGEYLFSASLPGQPDGAIYLTDSHRHELYAQVQHRLSDISTSTKHPDVARVFLYRMAQFRAAVALGGQIPAEERFDDRRVFADMETLRDAGVAEAQLETYLATRIALDALIEAEPIATMCQLRRLLSPAFSKSMRNAATLVPELSQADRLAIADEADQWFDRLAHELQGRAESRLTHHRDSASLQHDAASIALVRHLSRQREKNGELTVLVTGDALVFAAYRRWHSMTCPDEPFLLRRVAQYAPIFTLGDGDVVESPQPAVIDEFVELGLVPFNLTRSSLASAKSGSHRRMFSQHIADGDWPRGGEAGAVMSSLFKDVRSDWYRKYIVETGQLGEAWRKIETITLGLNPDLLSYRLASIAPDALTFQPSETAFSDREVREWIERMMASLHQSAVGLWMPAALESIRRFRDGEAAPAPAHVPGGMSFVFRLGDGAQGGGDVTVGRSAEDDGFHGGALPFDGARDEGFLADHPGIAFALAAFIAAESAQFPEAVRYAELCLEIMKSENGGHREQNVAEAERMTIAMKQLAKRTPQTGSS